MSGSFNMVEPARFEVLLNIRVEVFCVVTPCSVAVEYFTLKLRGSMDL